MRIPVGGFGFRVPEKGPSPAVGPESFGGGVPQAVGDLAQGVGDVGRAGAQINVANERERAVVMHEQAVEAKQLDREAKRAQAMTVHARAQNALAEESDRIRLGIADGTINKDEAAGLWAKSSQTIVDGFIGNVDKANVDLVRAGLEGDLGAHGRQIQASVVQRNRHDIGAGLTGYLEQQERFATTDLRTAVKQAHMAIDGLGPHAGLNPEQIGKAKQAFLERATFNVSAEKVDANRDNAQWLKSFAQNIGQASALDPEQQRILRGAALGHLTRLENQAIQAEHRRMAYAQTAINRLSRLIDNGLVPNPTDLDAALKMSRGTVLEEEARGLVRDQERMADLLKMKPQEQATTLKEFRAKFNKTGASPAEWQSLTRMERTVQQTNEQLKNDSLTYAATRGGAKIQPLDLTKPDTWADNLKQRATVVLGLQREHGVGVSLSGLMPEEMGVLKGLLDKSTPGVQADLLGRLRKGFDDPSVFRATLARLAPDDPVTAKAGIFAANDRQSQAGKSVAVEILTGAQILRPDTKQDGTPGKGGMWPMPKEDDLTREWANFTGTAYSGRANLRNADFQAAKALYAARSASEGDQSGNLNSRRWRAAMALVTGGIANHKGADVIMPYGMSYGDFKDGLKARVEPLQASLDPDLKMGSLLSLPLEPVEDGKYAFRAGDALVTDKSGKPIVVDFNAPPAPNYGKRQDGTAKGDGYFGPLKRPGSNDVSTEISIGVNMGGKEVQIPALVPTLTRKEIDSLLAGDRPSKAIADKAVEHARQRMAAGKSPFAGPGEQVRPPQ